MRKNVIAAVILFLATCLTGSVALAASSADVRKAVELAQKNHQKAWVFTDRGNGNFDVVFVERGRRYTMTYQNGAVNYYVRRNGSIGEGSLMIVANWDCDGKVNFGMGGNGKKHFDSDEKIGSKYRAFWQREFDRAIAATIRHFSRK